MIFLFITTFITQVFLIWSKTWNIRATAKGYIWESIISGVFIHIFWLVTTSIGISSVTKIMEEFRLDYLFVVLASTIGGIVGTYIGMKQKI
jgi:hypothetical protein